MRFRTHLSGRKIRRKLADDGATTTAAAGLELLSRKLFLLPLFVWLFKRGYPPSVSRKCLLREFNVYARGTDRNSTEAKHDRFVAVVPDGYVYPHSGTVFTREGEFVVESVAGPWSSTEFVTIPFVSNLFRCGPRSTTDQLRGTVPSAEDVDRSSDVLCPLLPRYRNYYHWTIETLPKLRLIDALRAETDRQLRLLVPPDPASWMIESLEHLDDGSVPVDEADSAVYRGESIAVASFVHTLTGTEYDWFKQRTEQLRKGSVDAEHSRRIYVSRGDARERRVDNQEEVLDALDGYGFEPYRLEELPISEQVRLFADAEVVVGPHGAGLSNIVYSEDVTVVELFGSNVKNNFARIADAAGFEYQRLQFRQDGPDIEVDVPRLVETVEAIVD